MRGPQPRAGVRKLFLGYLLLMLDFDLNLDGAFSLPLLADSAGWGLVWGGVLDLAPRRPSLGLLAPFCSGLALFRLTQFVPLLEQLVPGWVSLLAGIVTLYTHFHLFTDLAALTGEALPGSPLPDRLRTARTVLVAASTSLHCVDLLLAAPVLDLAASLACLCAYCYALCLLWHLSQDLPPASRDGHGADKEDTDADTEDQTGRDPHRGQYPRPAPGQGDGPD